MMRSLVLLASCVLFAGGAAAQVKVEDVWVRASLPHQRATGAFMRVSSTTEVRLVAASSPVAAAAEIHEMRLQDNIARMQRVDGILIKAGEAVELKPGGYHVMLLDLKAPVTEGETVALDLLFERAGGEIESVSTRATVRPLNAARAQPRPH